MSRPRFFYFTADLTYWPGAPYEKTIRAMPCSMAWDRPWPPTEGTLRRFLTRNAKACRLPQRILKITRPQDEATA